MKGVHLTIPWRGLTIRWRASALAGLFCMGAVVAGCGQSRTASPTSHVAEQHLEHDVLAVMNHNGLPVMDSYISCKIIPDGHTQTCWGQTDDAPATQVEGDFDVSSTNQGRHSCPGSLSVKVGSVQVDKVKVDPCR